MKILVRVLAVLLIIFFAGPAIWYFAQGEPVEGLAQLGALIGVVGLWAWYEDTHR